MLIKQLLDHGKWFVFMLSNPAAQAGQTTFQSGLEVSQNPAADSERFAAESSQIKKSKRLFVNGTNVGVTPFLRTTRQNIFKNIRLKQSVIVSL